MPPTGDRLRQPNLLSKTTKMSLCGRRYHTLGMWFMQLALNQIQPKQSEPLSCYISFVSFWDKPHLTRGSLRIAAPLHALSKDVPLNWSEQVLSVTSRMDWYPHQCLFIQALSWTTHSSSRLMLVCRAWVQCQSDGHVHPIAYASRSLHPNERNYGITELETLGLVWTANLFRPYLLGRECVVYTDHSTCTSLLGTHHPSAKLACWAMIVLGKSTLVLGRCTGWTT